MKTSRSVTITTCLAAITTVFASTVGAAHGQPMAAPPTSPAPGPAPYPPVYPAEAAPYPGQTSGPPSSMAPVTLPPPAESKSESTALWYSIGGTLAAPLLISALGSTSNKNMVVPGVIVGVGLMMVGPSFGHFYAAGRFKVTTGLGIRVIGTAVGMAAGLSLSATENCPPQTSDKAPDTCGLGGFVLAFLVVGGSLVVGTIWDVVTAGDAARAANQRAARVSWHAAPLVMPSPTGTVTGLAVGGSF